MDFTLEQFKQWVAETFPDNTARSIAEQDFRDGLITMAQYVFDTNTASYIEGKIGEITQVADTATSAINEQMEASEAQGAQVSADKNATMAALTSAVIAMQRALKAANEQELGQTSKGSWNVLTNNPAITAVPNAAWPDGARLDISPENGTMPFAGENFAAGQAVKSGDFLKKIGTQWSWVRNDSSLAVVKSNANEKAIAELPVKSTDSLIDFDGFRDAYGNFFARVHEDGGMEFFKILTGFLQVRDMGFESLSSPGYTITSTSLFEFAISDEYGHLLEATRLDGTRISVENSRPVARKRPALGTDIHHLLSYGQSLSVGHANVPITVSQKYNSLRFVGGIRTYWGAGGAAVPAGKYDSLVPAIETLGETPCSGIAEMLIERLHQEDGIAYDSHEFIQLLSAPGIGSQGITSLKKGTTYYANMLLDVTNGLRLADDAGKTYDMPCMFWTQGETDTVNDMPTATYVTHLKQLIIDADTDVRAITGRTTPRHLVMYQTACHAGNNPSSYPNIGLAQAQVAREVSNAHVAVPAYIFDYVDTFHLSSVSSKWLGNYYALAYKRAVIDKEEFKPFTLESVFAHKKVIEATFYVPYGKMVLDTTWVTNPGNYGFRVISSTGAVLPITSVAIVRSNVVRIVLPSDLPAGSRLQYGIGPTAGIGRTAGARGNLRDSQGDAIIFDEGGLRLPMHNWCLIFDQLIN